MKEDITSHLSTQDLTYLQRCLFLARLGSSKVFPNPQVGAIIVHNDTIIGEGHHAYAGGPHAEIVALRSVKKPELLSQSTMYVSLEPCSHHGKTPPCSSAIIQNQIPRVVIGCLDPNPKVSGNGVRILREAGVDVHLAGDSTAFEELNKAFFANQRFNRPWITLKWAESPDGFIAGLDHNGLPAPTPISGSASRMLVHKLRSQSHAIMVGSNTAAIDNPSLTTRHFFGEHPLRLVFDRSLKLSTTLNIFQDGLPTVVLNGSKNEQIEHIHYYVPSQWENMSELTQELFDRLGICSILVEGGTHLLQQFLDQGIWDEIWRFQGGNSLETGVPAPIVPPSVNWHSIDSVGKDSLYLGIAESV